MEKNKLLSIATSICNIVRVFILGSLVIITAMLLYWHINPGDFNFIEMPSPEQKAGIAFQSATITLSFGNITGAPDTLSPESIKPDSIYIFYVQSAGLGVLWLLILREIKQVIASVQGLQTFRQDNSGTFRKIGWYCFYIFLLSGFEWLRVASGYRLSIYFDLVPLVFMLICFVLAEVFEEGNRLYEEDQMTI